MVHIFQNDVQHNHVHGDNTVKLSHATCVEPTTEEQIQREFDSAEPDVRNVWNVPAAEGRHYDCHEPPPKQKRGCPKPNQLSLTLLRSCRQIYLEANTVPYSHNTFAINCNDILERFARNRCQNKQNLAIRSLYLNISVSHGSSVNAWSDSINKAVLKRLNNVQRLNLTLGQLYCMCSVELCGYEGSEMTERQAKMFKNFSKLPLKKATLLIDDGMFLIHLDHHHSLDHHEMEQKYRWTMKQKQEFSKDVRDVMLRR